VFIHAVITVKTEGTTMILVMRNKNGRVRVSVGAVSGIR